MVFQEAFDIPSSPIFAEASGTTALIAGAGATENFTLDVIAFPLLVHSIKVVSLTGIGSVNFDMQIFEDSARTRQGLVYQNLAASLRIIDRLIVPMIYRPAKQNRTTSYGDNISTQTPIYCTITNHDLLSTFYVEIRYKVQGGPFSNDLRAMVISSPALTDNV